MQNRWLGLCFVILTVLSFTGCEPKDKEDGADSTTTTSSNETADDKIEAAMAKLDPADRELAEKQKSCPVSNALLGSMGKPYKMNVEGRDVFLCCSGCEGAIKEDPAKYLAKLPE